MNQRVIAQQLEIQDIQDSFVELRDSRLVIVLETTSVNLDLKSEAEADVLITHYQHLLQSLTSPIQILVQTRSVEMDEQYAAIERRIGQSTNVKQRNLLVDYREFLSQLVVGRNMLTRKFYIALTSKPKSDVKQAREQLLAQKEQISQLLQPLEIKVTQLDGLALANLFYAAFQPGKSKLQPLVKEIWS
jgi:hypothetical protein